MTVEYLRDSATIAECRITDCPPNRYAMGYGRKIPTSRMIRLEGEKIWRRVYVMCWSNCGTAYVIVKGRVLVLDEFDMPEERRDNAASSH